MVSLSFSLALLLSCSLAFSFALSLSLLLSFSFSLALSLTLTLTLTLSHKGWENGKGWRKLVLGPKMLVNTFLSSRLFESIREKRSLDGRYNTPWREEHCGSMERLLE